MRANYKVNDAIKLAIDQLYQVFKRYKIEDPATVSCFDYGPTAEEVAGISKDLRDIPTEVLDGMEFYGAEWGTENEVKYFIPRLLESISENPGRLNNSGYSSLFKYKLQGCVSVESKELPEKRVLAGIPVFSQEEKTCLRNFFDTLLKYHSSKLPEIGILIECALVLGMSPACILANWSCNETFHQNQVIELLNYFDCSVDGHPQSVHLEKSAEIKKFSDLLYTKLTPGELAEILGKDRQVFSSYKGKKS